MRPKRLITTILQPFNSPVHNGADQEQYILQCVVNLLSGDRDIKISVCSVFHTLHNIILHICQRFKLLYVLPLIFIGIYDVAKDYKTYNKPKRLSK